MSLWEPLTPYGWVLLTLGFQGLPGRKPIPPARQETHPTLNSSPVAQSRVFLSLPIPPPRTLVRLTLIPHTSREPRGMNHFTPSRLYFLVLKRAPILLLILGKKKKRCLFLGGFRGGRILQYIHANEIFHLMDFIPVLSMHILNKLR